MVSLLPSTATVAEFLVKHAVADWERWGRVGGRAEGRWGWKRSGYPGADI
jgi:hypothetical protein